MPRMFLSRYIEDGNGAPGRGGRPRLRRPSSAQAISPHCAPRGAICAEQLFLRRLRLRLTAVLCRSTVCSCATRAALSLRVRVESMGPQKCRKVGESQSCLIMINPIIFTCTVNPRSAMVCSLVTQASLPTKSSCRGDSTLDIA
eukprot:SAG25_NODE_702_length_5870_cov_4.999653_1_plen_144_part_00